MTKSEISPSANTNESETVEKRLESETGLEYYNTVMRFQWWLVLFGYRISVCFLRLRDLNDSRFGSVMRFKWQCHFETNQTVSFALIRDFSDGLFCSFARFQRWSVLFFYKISMTVRFVPLQDFSDGWFCSFTRFQWLWVFYDGWFSSATRFQRQ